MKKINIRESLLQFDKDTSCQYDLTSLYEACNLNDEDKKKLVQYIDAKDIDATNRFLTNKATEHGFMESVSDDVSDEELASLGVEKETLTEDTDADTIEQKIKDKTFDVLLKKYDEEFVHDYCQVKMGEVEGCIQIRVNAEVSYSDLEDLGTELTKVITEFDPRAYFEPECPGRLVAYVRKDQSEDIVDEETFKLWADKFNAVSSRDELFDLYAELVKVRDEINSGTLTAIYELVTDKINEFPELAESLNEDTDDNFSEDEIYTYNGKPLPKELKTKIKKVIIDESVTEIYEAAFSHCANLENITIPNNVTKIGREAFYNCDNLRSVKIGDGVTYISDYAFGRCKKLKSVTFGNSLKAFGYCAFADCDSLESVTIPDSVTIICYKAFTDCHNLKNVVISHNVKTTGYGTFDGCTSLTNVTIPDGVTGIDDYAFSSCKSLQNIRIPTSVDRIGKCAFAYCDALTTIIIPDSVTEIGENAFYDCTNVTIKCNKNSYAYKYTQENNIPVQTLNESLTEDVEVIYQKGNKKIVKDGYGYAIDDGINVNRFYVTDDGKPKFDDGCKSKFWLDKVNSLIKAGKLTSGKPKSKSLTEDNEPEKYKFTYNEPKFNKFTVGGKDVPYTSHEEAKAHMKEDYPMESFIEELVEYMKGNNLYYSPYVNEEDKLVITVEDGDWKHEHLYLDRLIGKFFFNRGLIVDTETEVTEQDGSDCYSANHIYELSDLIFSMEIKESLEKIATNSKGDYLVASDSGKGFTAFNKNDVCIGGIDGDDQESAINRFKKGDLDESIKITPDSKMKEIDIEDKSETGDVGHPIKVGLKDPTNNLTEEMVKDGEYPDCDIYKVNTTKGDRWIAKEKDSETKAGKYANIIATSKEELDDYLWDEDGNKFSTSEEDIKNKLSESLNEDTTTRTVGIYGDEVRGMESVEDIVKYLKGRGLTVSDVEGDMEYGWEMNVTGTPSKLYTAIVHTFNGYNSETVEDFISEYAIDDLDESIDKSTTKSLYMCNNCHYEVEMNDEDYDGCCPNCHEHHGDFEKVEEGIVKDVMNVAKAVGKEVKNSNTYKTHVQSKIDKVKNSDSFKNISKAVKDTDTYKQVKKGVDTAKDYVKNNIQDSDRKADGLAFEVRGKDYKATDLKYTLHGKPLTADEVAQMNAFQRRKVKMTVPKGVKPLPEGVASATHMNWDDDDDFTYDADVWEDEMGVESNKDFFAEGSDYTWMERVSSIETIDFDNWAVWSALNQDTGETEYFVVDEDTEFIDWGPVDTEQEAKEFLQSKVGDYNLDESLDEAWVMSLSDATKNLNDADKNGFYKVMDNITCDPSKCPLDQLENEVGEIAARYTDGNASPEYEGEDFADEEYSGSKIYNAILRLYGRDKEITESVVNEDVEESYDAKTGYNKLLKDVEKLRKAFPDFTFNLKPHEGTEFDWSQDLVEVDITCDDIFNYLTGDGLFDGTIAVVECTDGDHNFDVYTQIEGIEQIVGN